MNLLSLEIGHLANSDPAFFLFASGSVRFRYRQSLVIFESAILMAAVTERLVPRCSAAAQSVVFFGRPLAESCALEPDPAPHVVRPVAYNLDLRRVRVGEMNLTILLVTERSGGALPDDPGPLLQKRPHRDRSQGSTPMRQTAGNSSLQYAALRTVAAVVADTYSFSVVEIQLVSNAFLRLFVAEACCEVVSGRSKVFSPSHRSGTGTGLYAARSALLSNSRNGRGRGSAGIHPFQNR